MPPPRLNPVRIPSISLSLQSRPCPFLYPPFLHSTTYLQTSLRYASHQSQGRANRAPRSAGKRLGLKRGATELVVPGTIIFRQRGTTWFPGENTAMGRDHTIYATEKGYVVYYKDAWRGMGYKGAGRVRANPGNGGMHYKRYIGIVFKKGDTLPRPEGRPRERRLGMRAKARKDLPAPIIEGDEGQEQDISGLVPAAGTLASVDQKTRAATPPKHVKGYQIRETNYSIGRAAERAGVKVRPFKRGNRWLAWRKRTKRIERVKAKKEQKKARKGKGAKKEAASGNLKGA